MLDFFLDWIIRMCNKLPNADIDTNQLTESVQSIMGKVNYFVPIYMFVPIFAVWSGAVFSAIGVYLFIKFFQKFLQ